MLRSIFISAFYSTKLRKFLFTVTTKPKTRTTESGKKLPEAQMKANYEMVSLFPNVPLDIDSAVLHND